MAKKKQRIKIFLDPIGDTINVWWDNPKRAHISEESDSRSLDVLVRDKQGKIIGFEKIGFFPTEVDWLNHWLYKPETFYLTERPV